MTPEVVEVPTRPPRKSIKRKAGVGLKRKPRNLKRVSKKKPKKVDIWREYGLERPHKPRYAGLRGVLWHVLSLYVRLVRDKDFPCINCDLFKDEYHGGHFIATGTCGWDGLALDELNVHKECSSCNFRDKQKLKYARNLDRRYGPGTADKLRNRYYEYLGTNQKNWSNERYRQEITRYLSLLS